MRNVIFWLRRRSSGFSVAFSSKIGSALRLLPARRELRGIQNNNKIRKK